MLDLVPPELDRKELHRSERFVSITRLVIAIGILVLIFVSVLEQNLLLSRTMQVNLVFGTVTFGYALATFLLLKTSLPSRWIGFVSSTLDVLMITGGLAVNAIVGSQTSLGLAVSSGYSLYFPILLIPVLRHNPIQVWVISAVAALGYATLSVYTYALDPSGTAALAGMDVPLTNELTKSIVLLGFGVIASLITSVFNRYLRRLHSFQLDLAEAKEAAERANLAKDDFLATVSHELRTPLTGIIGTAEVLEQDPAADTIRGSAEHLLAMINDLLDMSRIESGRLRVEHQPVLLDDVIFSVCHSLSAEADKKGIDLFVDLQPSYPPALVGDKARLTQVIFNLVGNAVKFTKAGHVTVRCMVEEPEQASHPFREVRLEIQDTGIGIPPDRLSRIFDKYVQANEKIGAMYGGSGLGLTITKALLDAMGGLIKVDSQPGVGSRFSISLLLALSPELRRYTPPQGCVTRVVLVDPRSERAAHHRQLLTASGCHVLVVPGPDALSSTLPGASNDPQGDVDVVAVSSDLGREMEAWLAAHPDWLPETVKVLVAPMGFRGAGKVWKRVLHTPLRPMDLVGIARGEWPGGTTPFASHISVQASDTENVHSTDEPRGFAGSSFRVLLVEDVEVNRRVIARMLESAGCMVDEADTGAAAIDLGTASEYGLVLMDRNLPDTSGVHVARRIRETRPDAIIIALTGDVEQLSPDDRRQFDGVMQKPVRLREIKDLVASYRH